MMVDSEVEISLSPSIWELPPKVPQPSFQLERTRSLAEKQIRALLLVDDGEEDEIINPTSQNGFIPVRTNGAYYVKDQTTSTNEKFGKKQMDRALLPEDDGEDDEITNLLRLDFTEDMERASTDYTRSVDFDDIYEDFLVEYYNLREKSLDSFNVEDLQDFFESEDETTSTSTKKSLLSDTINAVGDVSTFDHQINFGSGIDLESYWPEWQELLQDNTDYAGDASLLARTALGQISSGNFGRGRSFRRKINKERIFVMVNFLIELLSAAFDQLSSVHKPKYALIAMLMSFMASIICIIELAVRAGKGRVVWRWESKLPRFYYPSPINKRFGTFYEIIGLICVILQSILSAIIYTFYMLHADYPIKISFWPLVFAFGLLCSKFMHNPHQKTAFRRD